MADWNQSCASLTVVVPDNTAGEKPLATVDKIDHRFDVYVDDVHPVGFFPMIFQTPTGVSLPDAPVPTMNVLSSVQFPLDPVKTLTLW